MAWQSVEDELREQFYNWEFRGRGWMAWQEPVHLEPPFRPFFGHFIKPRPVMDDGRHDTALSRLAGLFKSERGAVPQASNALAVIEEEPEPPYFRADDELHPYILHVPRDRVVRPDAMAACLAS